MHNLVALALDLLFLQCGGAFGTDPGLDIELVAALVERTRLRN